MTYSIVSGPATITGNMLSVSGTAGTVVVKAAQVGNETFSPVSTERSFDIMLVLGIEDKTLFGIKIFPNPSSDIVNIELDRTDLSVSLLNTLGRPVWSSAGTGGQAFKISTAQLPRGLYLFHVSDGKTKYTQKVMLE